MNSIIYGSTDTGKRIYDDVKDTVNVICFLDDDPEKWGKKIHGLSVCNPNDIKDMDFDEVIIGVLTYHMEVFEKLLSLNVSRSKINELYVNIPTHARIECLRSIHALVEEENIPGNVAELGVFRGEFAKEINKIFSDRTLYLFDTFEGFHERDTSIEVEKKYSGENRRGYFANTSIDMVMSQMMYPDRCVIRGGWFPETTKGIEDTFCFVNLDADLYEPTLSGLKYFYPRMEAGGIILIHDFFSKAFIGVKDAVREFCGEEHISYMPIGDTLSVGIRKIKVK